MSLNFRLLRNNMKIHVLLSPLNADEIYFTGKTTVVIDVLRATTTITAALGNGAREIIPVNTVEFAMKVSGTSFGGQTLLAGERNAVKIDGFAMGNSPNEFTSEIISGKSIILYTTNGSKAIVKAKFSDNLFIASFNNIGAVASHLHGLSEDVNILCSGMNGMFCMEDSVCAGLLISEIKKVSSDVELTDSGKACEVLYEQANGDILTMLKKSEHGRLLEEKGFSDDLAFCAGINTTDVVPVYSTGVIKPYVKEEI